MTVSSREALLRGYVLNQRQEDDPCQSPASTAQSRHSHGEVFCAQAIEVAEGGVLVGDGTVRTQLKALNARSKSIVASGRACVATEKMLWAALLV
jgi:hypothetical protein